MAIKMKAKELETLGGRYETGSDIENKRANISYLRDHYGELVKRYPNHWVMIGGGKVISAESSPDRLIGKLSRIRTGNKIVYYLASPRQRMLL